MKSKARICIALVLGLSIVLLMELLIGYSTTVQAHNLDDHAIYYVAPNAECGSKMPCFGSIQSAVDAVDAPSEMVKVAAGVYTDVHVRPRQDVDSTGVVTQIVYISKTLTLQGGYDTTDWINAHPAVNQTTLDAQNRGRVLYVAGAVSPTIEGFEITGGNAAGMQSGSSANSAGGAVYIITATATLQNNLVYSNTPSSTYGGAVYLRSSPSFLSHNMFLSNTANLGGALLLTLSNATLTDNIFAANSSTGGGGAVYLHASSYATLTNNIFRNNSAASGGGLTIVKNSDALLINNFIVDNQADVIGSGIRVYSAAPRLLHNTIVGNNSSGISGIHITKGGDSDPSHVALTNTILVSHNIGIEITDGNTVTINGILFDSGTPITLSQASGARAIVKNAVIGNPYFLPESYHLTYDSSARDRGVSTTVTTDYDEHPRPIGAGFDLGADEFPADFALSTSPSNLIVHAGDEITLSISITNTGVVSIHTHITETLHSCLTTSKTTAWAPRLDDLNAVWTQTFTATVGKYCPLVLTNVCSVVTDVGIRDVQTDTLSFVNRPPQAKAGEDQNVGEDIVTLLDGRLSSDPDGHLLNHYRWTQMGGSEVSIIGADEALAAFLAPSSRDLLTFSLIVTDELGLPSLPDEIVIRVGPQSLNYLPLVLRKQ